MYINKGGTAYNYCPGKATWDVQVNEFFHRLVLMCEMKVFPKAGGIDDQDSDIIETLAWFLPKYDLHKFIQRAEMVLGGGDSKTPEIKKPAGKSQTKGR